ncbi:MAG: hypothetical protein C0467_18215 [Planctomycetaceae bacterium]|nr:hypothetical protein [Planctomycetaceae bacterium]
MFDLVDWYDQLNAGSGDTFFAAFEAALQRILVQPRGYGRVSRAPTGREVREALIRGYLVLITFEVTATEVVILSVTHARAARRPWRQRLL